METIATRKAAVRTEENNKIADYSPSVPSRPGPAMTMVDIPSSRKECTMADFIIPTRSEFANAVEADPELQIVMQWLESIWVPTSDKLTAHMCPCQTVRAASISANAARRIGAST